MKWEPSYDKFKNASYAIISRYGSYRTDGWVDYHNHTCDLHYRCGTKLIDAAYIGFMEKIVMDVANG